MNGQDCASTGKHLRQPLVHSSFNRWGMWGPEALTNVSTVRCSLLLQPRLEPRPSGSVRILSPATACFFPAEEDELQMFAKLSESERRFFLVCFYESHLFRMEFISAWPKWYLRVHYACILGHSEQLALKGWNERYYI